MLTNDGLVQTHTPGHSFVYVKTLKVCSTCNVNRHQINMCTALRELCHSVDMPVAAPIKLATRTVSKTHHFTVSPSVSAIPCYSVHSLNTLAQLWEG